MLPRLWTDFLWWYPTQCPVYHDRRQLLFLIWHEAERIELYTQQMQNRWVQKIVYLRTTATKWVVRLSLHCCRCSKQWGVPSIHCCILQTFLVKWAKKNTAQVYWIVEVSLEGMHDNFVDQSLQSCGHSVTCPSILQESWKGKIDGFVWEKHYLYGFHRLG